MSKNKGKKAVNPVVQAAALTTLAQPAVDAKVAGEVDNSNPALGNEVSHAVADAIGQRQNDAIRMANILAMHKLSKPQWEKLTDEERAEKTKQFDAVPPKPTASVADIGKNAKTGKRGPTGPRTGDAMGAKPLVRKLMGTAGDDGVYPAYSIDMLCAATKKSEVNIRTILSDLRSPKYCGAGGVFKTHSFKEGNVTMYRFGDLPAVIAAPVVPAAAVVGTVPAPAPLPSPDGMGEQKREEVEQPVVH